MNSLQASLNEKEIQWPCKKKKNVHHRLKIFSSFFDEKISGQLKHEGSNLHSIRYNKQKMFCFNTRFELYRCSTNFMSSTFWLLSDASRDFSHAEKERTAKLSKFTK
jgi:hypothetical protein